MHYKQEASTDDESTLQKVQPSTQAQDTSPPHQQAVAAASLGDEQLAVILQFKRQRGKLIGGILIGIAIVLIIVGATVCVLNISGIINGPWSSIFGAIITSTGVVISLIRHIRLKFSAAPLVPVPIASLPPNTQPLDLINEDLPIPPAHGQEGLLRVYTTKSLRGFTVDLCNGFDSTTTFAAQNIVERKLRGETCYIAIFQSLLPGGYTAHIYRRELMTRITIYPGQVTEIDWR